MGAESGQFRDEREEEIAERWGEIFGLPMKVDAVHFKLLNTFWGEDQLLKPIDFENCKFLKLRETYFDKYPHSRHCTKL